MAAIRKNDAGKDVMVGGLVNWSLVRNTKKNVDFIRARIGSDGDFLDVYINNAADQEAVKALFKRIQKAKADGRYMLIENVGPIQETQGVTKDNRPVTNRRVSVGVTQVSLPKYKNSKSDDNATETSADQDASPAPQAGTAALEAMTAKLDEMAAAMVALQQRLDQATAAQPVAVAAPKKPRPRKAPAKKVQNRALEAAISAEAA